MRGLTMVNTLLPDIALKTITLIHPNTAVNQITTKMTPCLVLIGIFKQARKNGKTDAFALES